MQKRDKNNKASKFHLHLHRRLLDVGHVRVVARKMLL